MRKRYLALAALPILAASTVMRSTPEASYRPMDRDAEPLKATFNADAGKVRVLMLVAPT